MMMAISPSRFAGSLVTVALSVGLLLAQSGCSLESSQPVFTLNKGTIVTKTQYEQVFDEFLKRMGFNTAEKKREVSENPLLKEQFKQMALNKLIFTTLLNDETRKLAMEVSDKEVSDFKAENIKKIGGRDGLMKALKADGILEADFDRTLKEELLIKKFVDHIAADKVKVSDAEAEAFYNAHKANFHIKERVKASHILFQAIEPAIKKELMDKQPNMSASELDAAVAKKKAEKQQKAAETLAKLQKDPKQFEDLAKTLSDDKASGLFGGDLNYLYQTGTEPNFWQAIIKAKPGELIPQVVQTMFGYHVIKVMAHEPDRDQTFAEVKEQLVKGLQQERRQKALMEWIAEKRKTITIDFAEGYKPKSMEAIMAEQQAKMGNGQGQGGALPAMPMPAQQKAKAGEQVPATGKAS